MKVSLVVASGVHQGKVIPIIGSQFVIGRDPQCQLRPASQAVSKQHCALILRGNNVYLKDFGSTNGTVLNDSVVKGEERQVKNNDSLKIGPLDFTVRIDTKVGAEDGTPLPEMNPAADVAIAAVKAAASPKEMSSDHTPAPGSLTIKPSTGSKESAALASGPKEVPALTSQQVEQAEQDHFAAMLLGMEDSEVPGGSTVVDVPNIGLGAEEAAKEGQSKPDEKKPEAKEENSSSAASELLRKYMRRPR